ncbi:aspartate aminotransferase family protein [Thermoflavimicrobium daqui]|uniref:glutamate-1-semialdehyde 2,1-aminomutase n=1 Tax=Thermoflavimicrobium daqui TaxID=2137476 RepID=A0A364K959_9BACL|nr:aspartate aminotransferase family protein [Thermoflavimicrobium daqui]RAL26824.1 aspartate aminotransferase family protein [Thermoflavimicrobium daqui]
MDSQTIYLQRTRNSSCFYQEAQSFLPGGVTANIKYFEPYPIVMKHANGAYVFDIDQNKYIDYNLCYGALLVGHGHPQVYRAIEEQLQKLGTTILGTPHLLEVEMAKSLVDLYPSIESVRYTNSGLEATMLAIRLAMAWTGRQKIAKFEGHYHGGYDQVLVSVHPTLRDQSQLPPVQLDSCGIPSYYQENTVVLPFNQIEQTAELLKKYGHELAAVILEPVQGGYIPPDASFLKELRELTRQYGIVLIFDEVKTGFRLGLSGAQGRYGVTPDLTALGKVLGGGFPVGAVGGRKEIMQVCSPIDRRDILGVSDGHKTKNAIDILFHSGTYNGHPLVLAAGLATIRILEKTGVYQELEKRTHQLKVGMQEILHRYGIVGKAVGDGSIFNLVFSEHPVLQIQDVLRSDLATRKELDFSLLNQGVYVKPQNRFSLSIAHTSQIISETLNRFEQAVKSIVS